MCLSLPLRKELIIAYSVFSKFTDILEYLSFIAHPFVVQEVDEIHMHAANCLERNEALVGRTTYRLAIVGN